MKFKVGDKVKILRKDGTFGWDHNMAEDIGYTFLLGEDSAYAYGVAWCINGYLWSEDALELVSEAENRKDNPKYTVEEVFDTIAAVTPLVSLYPYISEVKESLFHKTDVQYHEYLRLKAIYEG